MHSSAELRDRCTAVLQEYLTGGGEATLERAYALGREALAAGTGVVEMVNGLLEALMTTLLHKTSVDQGQSVARRATAVFVETLSPFEMTHRGFREVHHTLRETEQRYRDLVEAAPDVIFTLSADGVVTTVNPAFERVTGRSREEWLGKPFGLHIHPDDLPVAQHVLQRVLRKETPPTFELRVQTTSGEYLVNELTATPEVRDGKVVGLVGIVRDITERKRAEMARRRLNERLEEEAKRIAHALHDEAGQLLSSVHLALETAARELPPPAGARLRDIRGLLKQIEEQLRRLSHELRPTILDDLGLLPALTFLARGVSKRTGIDITVDVEGEGRHPSWIEIALYRIVQEGLTNVARHAQATHVSIRVWQADGLVHCAIQDDGTGFDVSKALACRGTRGLGLLGIRERAESLGGTLDITSAPGRGTRLLVTIPPER